MRPKPEVKPRRNRQTPRQKIAANVRACQPRPLPLTGGRPSSYKLEYARELIDFMARGFSLTAFAGSIGVARQTLQNWADQHPEFLDALAVGRAARTLYWEKRLDLAGSDSRTVIFALRNACSDEWKEQPEKSPAVNVLMKNGMVVDMDRPPEEWGQAEIEAELIRRGEVPITAYSKPREDQ